ncbi:PREDICTED: integrin beta-6-like [Papilio xuthus]|uniref:Integrin beta-6-like n=1 Tax=Papilio xuthus TaxID=66420 RepID=A0AAJ6ZYC7_PAPXU|nr:PREDICTED: integrin beta-6-like [Papilio xuthus]
MAAKMWFVVCAVLITVKIVFGNDCSSIMKLSSCDECIRCGGYWCNDPTINTHCVETLNDDWCPNQKEELLVVRERTEPGGTDKPTYRERTVRVGVSNVINYKKIKPEPKIVNTTQNKEFFVTPKEYVGKNNNWYIEASPGDQFCSAKSKTLEEVFVEINIGADKEVIQYHVPCACQCSERAEVFSRKCSNRGTYACGVCSCPSGWSGKFCEKKECQGIRGDLQCTNPVKNDVECSGNGVCGPCEVCECYTDRPGSKYFDKENYCADICMTTNDCDECLSNPENGNCPDCHFPLIKMRYNETLVKEKDSQNRNIWITCNGTVDNCPIEYVAKKDDNGDVFVMVIKLCDVTNEAAVAGGTNVTIPVVLTVLLVAAAAAATAGYMIWRSRPPALPLADTQYQNIGAEDCVGSNPLYIPPTSYYNNPTYGKN